MEKGKKKMKKKWLGLLGMTLVAGMVLTACGANKNEATDETGAAESAKDKVSIMLDWYPNAVHSNIYVAKEKGYFDDEGVEVEIHMPSDANDPLKLAAADKVDIASSYQTQLLLSRSEGIPIQAIASNVQRPLDQMMLKKDSEIASPKDLEGQTVGYSSSEVREAIVKAMVKNDGGDPEKVSFVDVGFDLIPAIATDRVSAIMGGYINHELPLLEKEGYPIKQFLQEDYGVPTSQELVFVASEKTVKNKQAALEKFLRAVKRGQEEVVKNPETSLKVLLDHANEDSPLDPEIEKKSLETLLPLMGDEAEPYGYQSEEQYQALIDWMVEQSLIDDSVKAKESFVNILK